MHCALCIMHHMTSWYMTSWKMTSWNMMSWNMMFWNMTSWNMLSCHELGCHEKIRHDIWCHEIWRHEKCRDKIWCHENEENHTTLVVLVFFVLLKIFQSVKTFTVFAEFEFRFRIWFQFFLKSVLHAKDESCILTYCNFCLSRWCKFWNPDISYNFWNFGPIVCMWPLSVCSNKCF